MMTDAIFYLIRILLISDVNDIDVRVINEYK